jgi:hypothetical protein
MVADTFETLAAHNGMWNYPQYTMDIQSSFLMKCRNHGVKGYYTGMQEYAFGDIQLKFKMHEDYNTMGDKDEISYDMVMEYTNFRCTLIMVVKDSTVLRQWER